jgi:hypothetical protein
VSDAAQVLVFELAESDAVLGVGDVKVEDGPDEREAAGLAGKRPIIGTGLAAVAERERKAATAFGLSSGRCGSQVVPVETAN